MANVRIYELAKEIGQPSKVLVEELKKQGVPVKTHMSTIDEALADALRKHFAQPPEEEVISVLEEAPTEDVPPSPVKEEAPARPPTAVAEPEEEVEKPPVEVAEEEPATVVRSVRLSEAMTVKELAEVLEVKTSDVISKLMEMGLMLTINQVVDLETAKTITRKFGFEPEVSGIDLEELALPEEAPEEVLQTRPPVVTMMGHVDHGKTLLLDAIRKTRVVEKEVGGITQHIGAYQVTLPDRGTITFLDTPGHEAFTAMRARGAQVTDIVVLVVAADDGVMPQTKEAITHAREADVPIVVAINKIDKPNADPERVKRQLVELGVVPDDWGGDTIFVEVSAKEKINLDELLEMILLQAEILELKANPNRPAKGTVIEAKLDRSRGPVATVLIQQGTLREGQAFVAGLYAGRVRAMFDDAGRRVPEAGPSKPMEILGLGGVPQAGDSFVVVADERKARQIAQVRQEKQRKEERVRTARVSLEDLFDQIRTGEIKELKIILRADVQGSVQALQDSLEKLSTDEVRLRVMSAGVGGISETDIMLAAASNAIIIGFNVRPSPQATELADKEAVDIRLYSVIYDVLDDVKAAMEGLLEPTRREEILGRAEVREVFNISKVGRVAGCYVTDGVLRRNAKVRLLRDNIVIYDGRIASLKRFKDDVREVVKGYECGVGLENFQDIKVGDVLEPYTVEEVARKLED
jgi:translation initiation factor IF-2